MRLIDSIEINYFRSAYDVKLKNTSDLNIITGGNDAGKSNVLRAISLFFKNEPSPNEVYDFLEDVNHFREGEARDAKGRLTIWIKIHFNNVLGWQSLPKKFFIKKTWNRYSKIPDSSWSSGVSQSNITKFLNKIELHYVPAVKHPDIYSHYMRLLYEAIANNTDTDLKTPANALSSTINETAAQLRDDIEISLGVRSKIEIPTDFGALIERLRFSTEIHGRNVPLDKRGDGIQARHIPQVISYISSTNKNMCVWIYEEPENSLELHNSFKLAEQFKDQFCIENQVFISTHSPAFYGLSGDNVVKFIAARKDEGENKNITIISKFDGVDSPDNQLGIRKLIQDRSKLLYDEIRDLNILNKKLQDVNLPTVITEGDTDVEIFREAARRYYGNEPPVQFMSCDARPKEGGGHTNLAKYLELIPFTDSLIRIGVFDNDRPGRGSFEKLKGFGIDDLDAGLKMSHAGPRFATILPDREWDHEFFELAGRPVAIEQMFPVARIGAELVEVQFHTSKGNISKKEVKDIGEKMGLDCLSKLVDCKLVVKDKRLARDRIIAAPDSEFEPFEAIFQRVERVFELCDGEK